jgi:hypothetical protein
LGNIVVLGPARAAAQLAYIQNAFPAALDFHLPLTWQPRSFHQQLLALELIF